MRKSLFLTLTLLLLAGGVTAQDAQQQMRDGTVVISADQQINDDVDIQAATVIVNGTINGDLSFFAGTVYIPGTVNGSVDGYAGNIQIDGTVHGDTSIYAGNIALGPQSHLYGDLIAAGGNVYLRGQVDQSATVAGGSVELDATANIGGDLRYEAERFMNHGATIEGSIIEDVGNTFEDQFSLPSIPPVSLSLYGIVTNAVFGLLLLFGLPRLSKRMREHADNKPLRSIGAGVIGLIAIPILLVILMFTIVGIPIAIVGLGLLLLTAWMGDVYGKYMIGRWILEKIDTRHEPAAMVTGVIAVGLLAEIPVFGSFFDLFVLLFGFGLLLQVGLGRHPRVPYEN